MKCRTEHGFHPLLGPEGAVHPEAAPSPNLGLSCRQGATEAKWQAQNPEPAGARPASPSSGPKSPPRPVQGGALVLGQPRAGAPVGWRGAGPRWGPSLTVGQFQCQDGPSFCLVTCAGGKTTGEGNAAFRGRCPSCPHRHQAPWSPRAASAWDPSSHQIPAARVPGVASF